MVNRATQQHRVPPCYASSACTRFTRASCIPLLCSFGQTNVSSPNPQSLGRCCASNCRGAWGGGGSGCHVFFQFRKSRGSQKARQKRSRCMCIQSSCQPPIYLYGIIIDPRKQETPAPSKAETFHTRTRSDPHQFMISICLSEQTAPCLWSICDLHVA